MSAKILNEMLENLAYVSISTDKIKGMTVDEGGIALFIQRGGLDNEIKK